jgi:type IV pilus assembly protein PilE
MHFLHHATNARLSRHAAARPQAGFSLIELLCAMAIGAILAGLSFPSFQSAVLKARRADGLAALMQLQQAQERHRAEHLGYGTLAALRQSATSAKGHYLLGISHTTPTGYRLQAQAQGAQQADTACRHLQLRVDGLNHVKESGPTAALGNSSAENRQCWAL